MFIRVQGFWQLTTGIVIVVEEKMDDTEPLGASLHTQLHGTPASQPPATPLPVTERAGGGVPPQQLPGVYKQVAHEPFKGNATMVANYDPGCEVIGSCAALRAKTAASLDAKQWLLSFVRGCGMLAVPFCIILFSGALSFWFTHKP